MDILLIILGIILLLAGRRLYWFFVGVVGFVVGFGLASQYLTNSPYWVVLGVGLLAGFLGAWLATFVQQLAVAAAGFLAGGYLLDVLLNSLNLSLGLAEWLIFVIGGIVGAILVLALFEWALIILSSLMGASLLVQEIRPSASLELILLFGLTLVGIVIQASGRKKAPRPPTKKAETTIP